jgi:hypothetical protein
MATMSRQGAATSARREAAATLFRKQIEAAEAEGVHRNDMTLRLTLTDVTALQRDRTLSVADISFAGGVMRYLGVKIERGGVAQSVLDRGK